MKGEVPAKGTSPFFLIIIKFGTFFTHFEMILLYPEPYLSYFWCRIKRNRTNIMKITIKYICTGLSLCACTCLVNNLPAQAETTNTAAVSATETGLDRQSIMEGVAAHQRGVCPLRHGGIPAAPGAAAGAVLCQ